MKFFKKKIFGILLASSLAFITSYSLYAVAEKEKKATKPIAEKNKLKIRSDEARYDRKNKTALATGHVTIIQDNITIYTAKVLYNEEIKTSFIDQFVRIINLDKETNRKTDITANKMIVYHQEKKVHLEDQVVFDREEDRKFKLEVERDPKKKGKKTDREKTEEAIRRERSVITADMADYWTKTGDAIFTGNGVVLQKEKKALGDTITIKNDANKNTDTITLDKNAKLIQIRGDWLVNEGLLNPKEDKEKERFSKERLEMNGDKIIIYQKTSDVIGTGNVKIVQKVGNKQREAHGDKAVYSDINKTMTLTGNVRIKKENEDWMTSEKAVFHTDSENFEAYARDPEMPSKNKQVEGTFAVPDDENPTPEPSVGKPEEYINLDQAKKKNKKEPEKQPPAGVKPSAITTIPEPPKVLSSPTIKPVVTVTPVPATPSKVPETNSTTPLPKSTPINTSSPASTGEFSFGNEDKKNDKQ